MGRLKPETPAWFPREVRRDLGQALMDFLTALGQNVEITVKPARKKHGEVSLVA